jgi:hypothetical protein
MYTFELSEQMAAVIVSALGNHPYREAAPVIAELQRQATKQMPLPPTNGKADHVSDNKG